MSFESVTKGALMRKHDSGFGKSNHPIHSDGRKLPLPPEMRVVDYINKRVLFRKQKIGIK